MSFKIILDYQIERTTGQILLHIIGQICLIKYHTEAKIRRWFMSKVHLPHEAKVADLDGVARACVQKCSLAVYPLSACQPSLSATFYIRWWQNSVKYIFKCNFYVLLYILNFINTVHADYKKVIKKNLPKSYMRYSILKLKIKFTKNCFYAFTYPHYL